MFRSQSTKWIFVLMIGVMVAIGITIGLNNNQFATKTAVGQVSNDTADSQANADDLMHLERANRAFINLVNRVKPAVVQVKTTKLNRIRRPFNFDDDLFEFWFGPPRGRRDQDNQDEEEQEPREINRLGSGVIVSADGYVLTNNHVIEGAEDIKVALPNGREYTAELIGKDAGDGGTDLAVLKINAKDLPALTFGDSDQLQVGEWVVAIGSPFGLSQTVTRGIVSAKGRSTGIVTHADFIQTDTSINRGNSGGALVNIYGQLIGINTAIISGSYSSQGNVGIGFAIPSNLAKQIMTALITKGIVERGWLGVGLQPVEYNFIEDLNLDEPRGALIKNVWADSPAEKGNIKRGDVIVEVDRVLIRDIGHLMHVVAGIEAGRTVEVKVIRRRKEKVLKVKVGKRPPAQVVTAMSRRGRQPRFVPDTEAGKEFAGLRVNELTSELAERYGHEGERGVVVTRVNQGSPAAKAGIKVGDLIQEIEWEEVQNVDDYTKRINTLKSEPKVSLYVKAKNGSGRFLMLQNADQRRDE